MHIEHLSPYLIANLSLFIKKIIFSENFEGLAALISYW